MKTKPTNQKNKPQDRPNALLIAGIAAAVSLCVAWSWMLSLRMTNLTGSFMTGYFLALGGFGFMVCSSTILFLLVLRYFVREYQKHDALTPWFLSKLFLVWAATEYAISAAVALVWYGQGGSLDTVLPFGSFTPLLTYTPFGLLARFVGFYGLSAAFVVLVSTLAFGKLRKYAIPTVVAMTVLVGASWLLYHTPSGPSVTVQVISDKTDEPLYDIKPGADLTVLPEYGLDFVDTQLIAFAIDGRDEKENFFVGSRRTESEKGAKNVLMFGSSDQHIKEQRAKSRLIPAGEQLPYAASVPLNVFGADDMINRFKSERELIKGDPNTEPLSMHDGIELGSSICASIIAPNDYRAFAQNGATVFTNSAMLGIFDSPIFDIQHEGLAKFMAIANARPFAQSSTDGKAFVLDHNGASVKTLHPTTAATVSISANTKTTAYTVLGDWPVYVGLALILAAFAKKLRQRIIRIRQK